MAEQKPMATGAMDWNDLRLILAICRARSLSGAARELGQTHSTVFRRINGIEDKTGVRFFERLQHGYEMTDAGRTAMEYAIDIEQRFNALELEILGGDQKLEGRVRLTSPEAFAEDLAPGILARFSKTHPDIQVDLTPGHGAVDLSKREAEVAVRATRTPPETSFGKKICDFRFAVYGSPEYLAERKNKPADEHSWCLIEGTTKWLVPFAFQTEGAALERAVFQSRSTRAVMNACAEGVGLTLLPCYFADRYTHVERASDTIEQLDLTLWVLTHNDLKGTARVRSLMAHLYDELGAMTDLYAGQTAQPKSVNLFPR